MELYRFNIIFELVSRILKARRFRRKRIGIIFIFRPFVSTELLEGT